MAWEDIFEVASHVLHLGDCGSAYGGLVYNLAPPDSPSININGALPSQKSPGMDNMSCGHSSY